MELAEIRDWIDDELNKRVHDPERAPYLDAQVRAGEHLGRYSDAGCITLELLAGTATIIKIKGD